LIKIKLQFQMRHVQSPPEALDQKSPAKPLYSDEML